MTISPEHLPVDRRAAIHDMVASQPFRDLLRSLEIKAAVFQGQSAVIDDPEVALAGASTLRPQDVNRTKAALYLSALQLLQQETQSETPHYHRATLQL